MRARTLLIAFGIWLAVTTFFAASVMARYIGTHKSFTYVFYATGVHYALWALLSPLLIALCARWPLFQAGRQLGRIVALVLVGVVLAPLVSLAYLATTYFTYFPYRQFLPTFTSYLDSDWWNAIHDDFMTCVVLLVAFQGWRVWRDLQSEQMRASELERQLAVSRLDALRMQLHPHFLFNTFHTITGLIGEDPATARRMVIALSDLLRRTLEGPSAPLQSLARELEWIDLYMGIQRLRLGDRVSLDYDIDPDATAAEVPHLLLQPLFENAVRHGAARMAGPCAIIFKARRDNGLLRMSLENDAPAPAPAVLPSSDQRDQRDQRQQPARQGVGLTNTLDRLKLHYGDRFRFDYRDRAQGGVLIDLSLPYHHASEEARDVHAPARAGVAD
jgi:two-component system, LytTR family, sensor kinase